MIHGSKTKPRRKDSKVPSVMYSRFQKSEITNAQDCNSKYCYKKQKPLYKELLNDELSFRSLWNGFHFK